MRLDEKLSKELRIPTTGMEAFNLIRYQDRMLPTGLYEELRSTQAYRENGMLHYDHDGPPEYAYFIQREDGQVFVGAAPTGIVHFEIIREHLDPELKAEVILCAVPAQKVRRFGNGYLAPEYGLHIPAHREHPFRTNVNTYSGLT